MVFTAIGIEPDTLDREVFPHRGETGGHFFNAGNTGRVNIVKTWSKSCAKGFAFENIEEFKIRFGVFDGNDVGVESLDCPEDIVEIRLSLVSFMREIYIAEMAMNLGDIFNRGSSKTERVDCPLEIGIPFCPAQRTAFPQCRF
jgi:hypothetical protein